MYIIVVGGGKVGYYLTKTPPVRRPRSAPHRAQPGQVEIFVERFGAVVVAGDGAEAATLAAAGAARADVVIAVTGEDEDNLVICQMAQAEVPRRPHDRPRQQPEERATLPHARHRRHRQPDQLHPHLIEQSIPEHSFVHLLSSAPRRPRDRRRARSRMAHRSPTAPSPRSTCHRTASSPPSLAGHNDRPDRDTELLPGDDIIAIAHRDREDDLRRLLVA